ncbi:MAG: HlyC/CorC family transporter [Deltaproteobacteria bacterium]|nr:HlyC/CorC family transporter [Deltaproteobacteria bacterium]
MLPLSVQIIILLLLILANGLFSMSEIAIVASRPARLQQQAESGDAKASAALELARNPDHFLSTVQIGITLIGILTGAYSGTAIADRLDLYLARFPLFAESSRTVSFAAVVIAVTYLTLILGELVPKRLGLHAPERLASTTAYPMRALSKIALPVVRLLSASTNLVLRAVGVGPPEEALATEEEIKIMLEQGTRAGLFESAEQDMIARVFRLGDRRVSALMTPRPDIVWLDVDDSPEEIGAKLAQSNHSRFPVGQRSLDDVVGFVQVKDLLARRLAGEELDLRASLENPLFVPESMRALHMLELFKNSGTHMALVLDEYGSVQGLVTFYDVLEAIVGDIPTEEEPEPLIVEREEGSWLVDGSVPVDELEALLGLSAAAGEREYHTLGGLVMVHVGRIPEAADSFEWSGYRFEVVDMDGNRVDKVLISRLPEEETEEE